MFRRIIAFSLLFVLAVTACTAAGENALCGAWKYASPFGVDQFLVFREDGTWYAADTDGQFKSGTYTVKDKHITVRTPGTEAADYDYAFFDNVLRIYNSGIEYIPGREPGGFMLKMDGASMKDTLQDGDRVTFVFREKARIRRFDIVAAYYPGRGNTTFIRRVAGLPGDTVELKDGCLVVNGEAYPETYIRDEYRSGPFSRFGPFTVPEGKYFVMGDRRDNTDDSRVVGAIDEEMILGAAVAVNGKLIARDESGEGAAEAAIVYPLEFKEEIVRQARSYLLDPALVASIIYVESCFRSGEETQVRARGLMKLTPDKAEWIAEKMNISKDYSFDRLYDPETNIQYGCWYLNYLREAINGDAATMVTAFYTGENYVKANLVQSPDDPDWKKRTIDLEQMEKESPIRKCVQRVMDAYGVYRELYDWDE